MKFSGWLIASFLSSSRNDHAKSWQDQQQKRTSTTKHLVMPTIASVDVDHQQQTLPNLMRLENGNNYDVFLSPQTVISGPLNEGIRSWSYSSSFTVAVGPAPPTQGEVKVLREAFASLYGMDRDLEKAERLLSQTIEAWQRQGPDEQAALYRVRGDCYMAMLRPIDAEKDYSVAIDLLEGPGGEKADPEELPSAILGRARSIRSQSQRNSDQVAQAAKDYQKAVRLAAREDWDTTEEIEEDGALRNPYAAWEWGTTLRESGNLKEAIRVHTMASEAFEDIGDRTRAIIAALDVGIDVAASDDVGRAQQVVEAAIKKMKTVEGGDVKLLQSLLVKEGEARLALSSVLWDAGEKQEAETQFGNACLRLDQLEADAQSRLKYNSKAKDQTPKLLFSIDDGPTPFEISCSRFKNEAFLADTMKWPESLQKKVLKLENLK